MKSETIDTIRNMTLAARELLFSEIGQQLEGIYGLQSDGEFRPASQYPVLASNPEEAETRKRLETLLTDEKQAGLSVKQAREKLVQEAAFTWLNRLVALKMMEARKLIRQTLTKGQDSNGFKMWLVESGNEEHYHDYEAGDLPLDGLGEGPRQRAYRHFLLAHCEQLAREIRVLFDPDNLLSNLFPRPPALKQLLALLNDETLEEAWQPGNEETIGWVYQFFIETSKKEVFDRLYKQKKKIRAQDIPAATQIFTPRWIVKSLVENTLGRMWVQMHPNTRLRDQMEYLVPPAQSLPEVPLKPAGKIHILDPACGTMHFGLVAFDLLVEMYREEIEYSGQDGWPEISSVQNESEIPAAIIANNLHGIDIDLRAVQLSALTLYLRAKYLNPKAHLKESHLACADIRMLAGDKLKEFLKNVGLEKRPIYGRILTALQQRLKDSNQLGSLLRLEEEIQNLVEEERMRYERENKQPDLFGWSKDTFETEAGRREFWEMIEIQIGQALDAFARERASEMGDLGFFAAEANKGLRLLEITGQRYDVVLTNPPYMTQRNMNAVLKEHLKTEYLIAKSDLYAAFIKRCTEWLAEGGRLGMITQQSFMFTSSYKDLRTYLRNQITIEIMPHVGPRAFDEVSGEKVNTTLFVFRQEDDEHLRNESVGTYFRLVKEPDADAKRQRFELALTKLNSGNPDQIVFQYKQGDFDAISGNPWVYWIATDIRNVFTSLPNLVAIAPPRQGLATADNFRFLKYWWEIGANKIAFDCVSREESESRPERWYPYMKGGSFKRWYGNQEYIINYGQNGYELKAWADPLYGNSGWSRIIKSTDYYFRKAVTWSDLTSGRFSARLSPGGFVFDVKGSSAFPDDIPLTLALLNSSFAHFALNLLNPTISFQVGDLKRLPIPKTSSKKIKNLVEKTVSLAKVDSDENEITYDFVTPPSFSMGIGDVETRHQEIKAIEQEIDEDTFRLYGISNKDRAAIETELAVSSSTESKNDNDNPFTRDELACKWISYTVGIVLGRFEPGVQGALGRGDFPEETARQLRDMADSDGVMVLDEGHSDDLSVKVFQALQSMLGEDAAVEVISEGTSRSGNPESDLRYYFERKYFKEHIKQYRKRPVYWLLQSPRKKYGIWLFHERLTKDTLYLIRGDQYVASKFNLLESNLTELRNLHEGAEGRERRSIEKQIAAQEDILEDVRAFSSKIDEILERGYTPHIDDGVLINMAPLWELIPSWQADPKKCWQALEQGDYDWAHQAMDHWPERVKEECLENRSYVIAHGLEE